MLPPANSSERTRSLNEKEGRKETRDTQAENCYPALQAFHRVQAMLSFH
jgi:hypothetical protein